MKLREVTRTSGMAITHIWPPQLLVQIGPMTVPPGEGVLKSVKRFGNRLSLTVEDNGKGFDTARLRDAPGLGWANIIHRVEYLGGRCDIASRPGEGTSIHLELEL